MAFSIRPRSKEEIYTVTSYRADKLNVIAELYDYLTTNYRNVDRPLILNDANGGNKVKVHPEIGQVSNLTEEQLKSRARTTLKIEYAARMAMNSGVSTKNLPQVCPVFTLLHVTWAVTAT